MIYIDIDIGNHHGVMNCNDSWTDERTLKKTHSSDVLDFPVFIIFCLL